MTIPSDPNTAFPTTPIPAEGPLPKSRLTDARKAQEIYWNMHEANRARNAYGSYLQGINDGNNPYRQSALRNSGQGWRANFPTMEAKARKGTAKTPYYDLFASGPTYAEVKTSVKADLDAETASGIITEEFHEMQREWPGFDFNFWKMLDDFVGYGRGWLYRPTSDSWHFKRVPWWRVRFPDGTDVDPETWDMFSIEHVFDPVNLNSYIRDEESARDAGWNASQVRKALLAATPLDPDSAQDAMIVQQMIRDQDVALMYRASTVQAASIYVKEWDGSWSRMIIQTGKDKNNTAELKEKQWLYYKHSVAQNVMEILSPFFFEVETGSINGVSGILRDIVDQVKVRNRLICEQTNNAFLRSTVLMQAKTASSRVKGSLITVGGGVTLIPEGTEIQQSTILGDISAAMEVSQVIKNELDQNTGVFRPQMEKPQGNPEPLGATQLRFAQSTVLQNSAVNRFQTSCDWFYAENYRRATLDLSDLKQSTDPGIKSAITFQKRCRDRGVTEKQLREVESVRAVRVIGNGSPGMRQQLTAEIAQFLPVLGLGQRGIKNLGQMIISARGGQDMVDRLMPPEDEADLPSEQDREALQENGMIKIGSPVLRIENDNDMVHLRRHFEAGFAALQAVQQGGDPNEAAAFIQGVLPHIGEHIANLRNPEWQKEAIKTAKELQSGLQQLMSAIEQSRPDPEEQQRVLSDVELRQIETQAKLENQAAKTQAGIEDKAIKTQAGLQMQAAKASQDMAIKDATSAQDILIKAEESKAKAMAAAAKPAKDKSK